MTAYECDRCGALFKKLCAGKITGDTNYKEKYAKMEKERKNA